MKSEVRRNFAEAVWDTAHHNDPNPFMLSVQPPSRQDVTAGSDLVLLQI